MLARAAGQATHEGTQPGGRGGTHRGRGLPSRHDADQREVPGLVAAEGGRGVSGHHLDGGGRSCRKKSAGRAGLHWKVQREFTAPSDGPGPVLGAGRRVGGEVAQPCLTLCDPLTVARRAPLPSDSLDRNTRGRSPPLLQGIFPTQGSNPGLPHCRRILYQLSPQGSPTGLLWQRTNDAQFQGVPPASTAVRMMSLLGI